MMQMAAAMASGNIGEVPRSDSSRKSKYTEEIILGKCREYWREVKDTKLISGSGLYEAVLVIEAHIDHPEYGEGNYEYIITVARNSYSEMRDHIDNIKDSITPTDKNWSRIIEGGKAKDVEKHGHGNKTGYVLRRECDVLVKWMRSCKTSI